MNFDTKTRKLEPFNNEPAIYISSAAPYKTSDKTSFAYVSARDRWPVILVRTPTPREASATDA